MDDKKVVRSSQHGFIKGKSCLTNLTAFSNETKTWMSEGRPADVVHSDFFSNELGGASCRSQLPMLCPPCVLMPILGEKTILKTIRV